MVRRMRLARAQELARLQEIERRAGDLLQGHAAQAVFAAHALDAEALRAGLAREQLWVVLDDDRCAGYLLGGCLDAGFHVQQMDVDPRFGRRGHGRALLRHARAAAMAAGFPCMLLTTLRDVPWNAPFYASEGFVELPPAQWGPQLRATWQQEAALGFPMHLRVAMRCLLPMC
ncbi:GNAT family N-acetyltransferase [Xanthomonas sp. A2111]|uniref:GNAT family N-acetyltransferase n=1 Tax=Xanthomonas hawaiiensis TaxID=3003247 RepID=A0ABU2I3D3_9XANT|nr:GNAT family N-acetyltransferase [Xanthomonas sp. A2111]MBO9828930.1 GNAT family N-acetyltransferase [Xanthomonas sp. A2111]MDS9992650.1 GNAT family N-acetyltransferase [Xanthomonas sp. A2111]